MAGNSELSNSAWRLEDLKELEHPLNYDIASGFSDLEISLGKDVHGAYNMRYVCLRETHFSRCPPKQTFLKFCMFVPLRPFYSSVAALRLE
jgi:hypothetical protein